MRSSVDIMDQTADPAALFDAWMVDFRVLIAEDAGLTWPPTSADLSEVPPVLMTLATVGSDGYPRTRNVMVLSLIHI